MAETATFQSDRAVRVLLVDENEDDYLLTQNLLEDVLGVHFKLDWQANYNLALDLIHRGSHDVYLIDYHLGIHTGVELIEQAQQINRSAPLILLTGQGERERDFAAMRAGAADYLEKGKLDSILLERSIRYAIQKKQSEEHLEKRVRDRTSELAKTNEALQREVRERLRAEEALREMNRCKDEFLATLAHELRNPLAPVRNALEIIRLGANNPQSLERGRTMMERQVVHMVRLIDDLLDISRITRGKIQLRTERIDLAAVVANAIEGSRPLIDAGNHRLHVSLRCPDVVMDADPTRLTQILMNLLNNAAKYTESGGDIYLDASTEKGMLVLRVKDTGCGIPAEMLSRVFTMFAQSERSRERSQGGLGIGLSLVRGLVELHGGSVEAQSDGPGKGSEFIVRLPLPRLEQQHARATRESSRGAQK